MKCITPLRRDVISLELKVGDIHLRSGQIHFVLHMLRLFKLWDLQQNQPATTQVLFSARNEGTNNSVIPILLTENYN